MEGVFVFVVVIAVVVVIEEVCDKTELKLFMKHKLINEQVKK